MAKGDQMIKSYKDLIVWKKAMDLAEEIYRLSRSFPKEEIYCLTSQIRRAAVSVPSNIAEGNERSSTLEYLHFLSIARGSLAEIETQLQLAIKLTYITSEQCSIAFQLSEEISKMLATLYTNLKAKLDKK